MTRVSNSTRRKSFWRVFLVTGIAAVVLTAIPTTLDLFRNKNGDLCAWVGPGEAYHIATESGECVVRSWPLMQRFLLYFVVFGGALLGPFGMYVLLWLAKAAIGSIFGSRGRQGNGGEL